MSLAPLTVDVSDISSRSGSFEPSHDPKPSTLNNLQIAKGRRNELDTVDNLQSKVNAKGRDKDIKRIIKRRNDINGRNSVNVLDNKKINDASQTMLLDSPTTLTDLPTIAGVGIPTQVIPFTASAPFMQKSNLPEGSVFICVGALLGFLGLCVLFWRALVLWSLHRKVKRSASLGLFQTSSRSTILRPPGGSSFINSAMGSNVSLDKFSGANLLAQTGSNIRRSKMTQMSRRSLFYSPTADASLHTSTGANRNSTYISPTNAAPRYTPANFSKIELNEQPISHQLPTMSRISSSVVKAPSIFGAREQRYQRTKSTSNTPPRSPVSYSSHKSVSSNDIKINESTQTRTKLMKKSSNERLSISPNKITGFPTPSHREQLIAKTPSAYLEDLFDT